MRHYLKIHLEHYRRVEKKTKLFEIRENDRAFQKGDEVQLQAFDQNTGKYFNERSKPDMIFDVGDVYPVDATRVVFSLISKALLLCILLFTGCVSAPPVAKNACDPAPTSPKGFLKPDERGKWEPGLYVVDLGEGEPPLLWCSETEIEWVPSIFKDKKTGAIVKAKGFK